MVKKTTISKDKKIPREVESNVTNQTHPTSSNRLDFLRFGESYTSLILGIIVVIIATVLLLSFVRNKGINKGNVSSLKISQQVSLVLSPTVAVQQTAVEKKTIGEKQVEQTPRVKVIPGGSYIVAAGDTLWKIAEAQYKSGYNWVDIARANNLANPGVIHAGNTLIMPVITPMVATVTDVSTPTPSPSQVVSVSGNNSPTGLNRIIGNSYTVEKGDSLWSIAVRAYGDGYRWTKIEAANGLTNPSLIFSGNVLKIPRE